MTEEIIKKLQEALREFVKYHTDEEWKNVKEREADEFTDGAVSFLDVLLHNAEEALKESRS